MLLGESGFNNLSFERKFNNGLHGTNPNLDVVFENDNKLIAIECKFLEILSSKDVHISDSYKKINDHRSMSNWSQLTNNISLQKKYKYLDAGQLVKHFYGLCHTLSNKDKTLLYLYYEPEKYRDCEPYVTHRSEIKEFSRMVENDKLLSFEVLTYQELWTEMEMEKDLYSIRNIIQKTIEKYNI